MKLLEKWHHLVAAFHGRHISQSFLLLHSRIINKFCTFYRPQDRMRRLLVQILCITEVLLCAADSPPLSEDRLKSEAFINSTH